jgi:hypothetical protein
MDEWFKVPKWLFATPGISLAAKTILVTLDDHQNSSTGQCNPHLKTLAEETDLNERTIRRALDKLVACQLVAVTRPCRRGNSYRVAPRLEWKQILSGQLVRSESGSEWTICPVDSGQIVHSDPSASLYELDPLNKNKDSLFLSHRNGAVKRPVSPTEKPSAECVSLAVQRSSPELEPITALVVSGSRPETFEVWFEQQFWRFYPRKVGKSAALKAARRVATSAAARDAILAGLYRQLPNFESREQQYIPHAATWLGEKRWLEEPEPPRRPVESARERNFRSAAAAFLRES